MPETIEFTSGKWQIEDKPELRISPLAEHVAQIILQQWGDEFGQAPAHDEDAGFAPNAHPFQFTLGNADASSLNVPEHNEAYALEISADGVAAAARSVAGLLYAWQTLKQLIRQYNTQLPGMTIEDKPQLDWRIYHLDLKGTRRRLANLYDILPQLAELKINAVLVEYEDYLKLDRRPDIAIDEALTKDEVRTWITEARKYNVHVIPLVQTLGHLQYVLIKPQYEYLRERPDKISDICPSHPDSWKLVRDFLDEMIELHPDAPYFHAGLDEAHVAGTCERCKNANPGKQKLDIFIDWFNRVCTYVSDKGMKPLAWADMITSSLSADRIDRINSNVTLADWSYGEDAPTQPNVVRFKGPRVSREWLKRPNGPINQLPTVAFHPGMGLLEDLPEEDRKTIEPWLENEHYPKYVRTMPGQRMLASMGLSTMGASGVRVSFHGPVAPRFMNGQLNTLQWAQVCRETNSPGLIATSWSRGHSQAGTNAHPDLDWYGLATLGDAAWGSLTFDGLRDFDERFGFQYFGLPDGKIGDLYYLFDRTMRRMQIPMVNYLELVISGLREMEDKIVRNRDRFDLFKAAVDVTQIRYRGAFALLELEYFHGMWDRVDPEMKKRIGSDIDQLLGEIEAARKPLAARYGASIIDRDAKELAESQLRWTETQLKLNRAAM